MRIAAFEAVAKALHEGQVRYIVAGGLAVNAHGHIRNTMDIDLVIALDADNIQRAFGALASLGYRPLVSINAHSFSDEAQRQKWYDEKGMKVDRKSVVAGKSVSVRVDLGGRRIIKKNKPETINS